MTHRALIILLLPFAAFATDPFACVDPDIVDAFLDDRYAGSTRYSTELPAKATHLPVPAELELVGSMTSESNVTIAYKSGRDADTALSSSVESLKRAGWKDPATGDASFQGFHGGSPSNVTLLCHQSEPGPLSIEARNRTGDALLTFSLFRHPVGTLCAAGTVTPRIRLYQYLPDLEVPRGAELQHNSTEGGGDEYSATVVVSTTLSRDALLRHFDDQIRTQGWTADSDWTGGMTVGSVWTRDDSKGRPLVGTMRIAEASSGIFNARFTVISVAPGNVYAPPPCCDRAFDERVAP